MTLAEDGAAEVARLGQEGYALTLYGTLRINFPAWPSAPKSKPTRRPCALKRWPARRRADAMASADKQPAMQRSGLDPRQNALDSASQHTHSPGSSAALESNVAERPDPVQR